MLLASVTIPSLFDKLITNSLDAQSYSLKSTWLKAFCSYVNEYSKVLLAFGISTFISLSNMILLSQEYLWHSKHSLSYIMVTYS